MAQSLKNILSNIASYGNANVANYLPTFSGNLTSGNANLGNLTTSNYYSGNGSLLTAITGSNVTGTVANATYALNAGNAYSVAVANVFGIGNIATINTDGNVSNILYGNGVFAAAPAGGGTSLPSQTGNSGKYLTTNGTSTSWATITPGGSSGQIQYNNGGSFGGITNITVASGQTTARVSSRVSVESNSATSLTPNISQYDMYVYTALSTNGTLTIGVPTGTPLNGDKLMFRFQDDNSSGAVALGWNAIYRFINAPIPTTTGGYGKVTYVGCIYNSYGDGANPTWDVIASGTQI
jgi:hypothetical protein